MRRNYLLRLVILHLIIPGMTWAQCPISSFDAPSSVCLQENIDLKSNSTGATAYEWLLCSTEYSSAPTFNKLITNFNGANISSVYYSKFIEFNNEIFLYFISNATNKLYGVRITNPNTLTFQEYAEIDISSIVTGAAGFDIVNENGTWIGIISKISSPNAIIKITLSGDLKAITSSTDLSAGLTLASPFDVKILNDDGNYFAFIANQTSPAAQQVLRLSFGNSLSNPPTASYFSMPSGVQSASFDFYESCNSWTGFLSSRNGKIFRFDFGSNLENSPMITELSLGSALNDPSGLALVRDHDRFILLSQSRNGFFYSIDLGSNISNNLPTVTPLGNFKGGSRDWDIEVLKHTSSYKIVTSNFTTGGNGGIYAISFPQNCPASIDYSEVEDERITFSKPGTHKITLVAKATEGPESYSTKQVAISNSLSPQLTINSADDWCLATPADFGYTSNLPISLQLWNFGDTQMSSDANPSHQYSASGNYLIVVEATATNGCKNNFSKVIEILDPPQPLFEIPDVDPICTNNEFTFVNNTEVYTSNVSYNWMVNSVSVNTERDLKYTFTAEGNYDIVLEVSIPGCLVETSQTVSNVQMGPTVGFSTSGQCQEEIIIFTNTSEGDITGFEWNFGDGSTSTETNPMTTYESAGNYTVTLKTTAANGCISTTTSLLPVYSLPQSNFQLSLPPFSCSGSPSQFTDTTPNPTDSNITSWQWDFNDNGSTSTLRNPTHIYMNAGNYDVTLTTSTNYGCENSIIKSVSIAQSPQIEIVNTPSCDDVPVTFSTSLQGDIKSWNWQIGNTQYITAEPIYVFNDPGSYLVNLNAVGNNNCIASTSKNVVVPIPLIPDFVVQKNCAGQPAEFTDATTILGDPITLYDWSFGDTSTEQGSPAFHTYTNTGTYSVLQSVTTSSGCNYKTTKNINVGVAPTASFTPMPEVGVPPLNVTFNNNSQDANRYLWNFNDGNNSTSTEVSPQFTFLDFGDYVVDLTAYNAQNCSHTFSRVITAAIPFIDVGLENLVVSENTNGLLTAQVTILNRGNIAIQNLNLRVNLSGIEVQETVSESIPPYSSILYTLDFSIVNSDLVDYLCVEMNLEGDQSNDDNVVCSPIDNKVVVMNPYPNPTQGDIHFDWISPDEQTAFINIYDALGKAVLSSEVTAKLGFNARNFNTVSLSSGVYFLQFQSGPMKKTLRFVINR